MAEAQGSSAPSQERRSRPGKQPSSVSARRLWVRSSPEASSCFHKDAEVFRRVAYVAVACALSSQVASDPNSIPADFNVSGAIATKTRPIKVPHSIE
jgi:hypothetical protein